MSNLISTQIKEQNSVPPEIVKPGANTTNGLSSEPKTGTDPKRGKAVAQQQHNSEKRD